MNEQLILLNLRDIENYSPFSFSSLLLLSKNPVVNAFLLSRYALLFGFALTEPLDNDSANQEKKNNKYHPSLNQRRQ